MGVVYTCMESTINWEVLIGIAISAIAAVFGIYKYSKTRKEEYKKVFWQKRYENYGRVLGLASKIAVSNNLDMVENEVKEFRQYYWGKLAMIEDQQVLEAMVNFNIEIENLEEHKTNDFSDIKKASYHLARACRRSLNNTWNPIQMNDLADHKSFNNNAK